MKVDELIGASVAEVLQHATGLDQDNLLLSVLSVCLFIDPREVKQTQVQYPEFVRESNLHHPGKRKRDKALWQGREVTVFDNTKARDAFGRYIGKKMGGANREVPIGWEVAHIWGRVFDPDWFTAGWNLVLIPSFFRPLIEEQSQMPILSRSIQGIALKLYPWSETTVKEHFLLESIEAPNGFEPRVIGNKITLVQEIKRAAG